MKRVASTILVSLLLLSCAGRARHPGAAAEAGEVKLEPAWSLDLDVGPPQELRAAPGAFVVIGERGRLVGVDAASGSALWTQDLGEPVAGPATEVAEAPSGGASWLAVPLAGRIAIVDAGTGRLLASRPRAPGEPIRLSALHAGLLVLEGAGRASLLEPVTGASAWSVTLPSPPSAPGTACDDQILIGLESGDLLGLDSAGGETRWLKSLRAPTEVAPACAGRHILVATKDNALYALRLHRRSAGKMWMARAGADPAASADATAEMVLLVSKDTYLYGLKRRNGHLVFRIRLGRRPGPPALLDDLVLVSGTHATRLDAYRLPRGMSAGGFDLPVGSRFVTPPVVSGERVAMGVAKFGVTDSSRLIALARAGAAAQGAASQP